MTDAKPYHRNRPWRGHRLRPAAVSLIVLMAAMPAQAQEPATAPTMAEPAAPNAIGGGPRWGRYAMAVHKQVEEAMRKNAKTRTMRNGTTVELRLWCDADGRIEHVQLTRSTGDAEIDRAIETEVLPPGLSFDQAPPKDMPMPIVVRMTARRPN